MLLGDRLRALRDTKKATLRQIKEKSGLRLSFLLRVEGGHAVPDIDQLARWASALGVPVYELFNDGENSRLPENPRERLSAEDLARFQCMDRLHGIMDKLP